MGNKPSYRELIEIYFRRLFEERDLSAIDDYLDKGYRDTDIPSGVDDHIKNSKDYINSLFARYPP